MKTAGRLITVAVLFACLAAQANGQFLEEWVARYDGPAESRDKAWDMALGPNGSVYVTGESHGGSDYDYATVKYDAYGNEQWSARYDGPTHGVDRAYAIAVDSEGNAYVTGQSEGSGSGYDYVTIKYDTDGNREWVARYDGPASGTEWARGIAPDGRGGAYVTGRSWGIDSSYDYATIRYDSEGNQKWVVRYNGPANAGDAANTLVTDERGFVYVSGMSGGGASRGDYATIKYDSLGTEMWVARYNGPANGTDSVNWGIAVDDSGNVYVTGQSDGEGSIGNNDFATVKYDSLGNELWSTRYNGPAGGDDDGYDIAVSSDGSVYVIGRSWGGSHNWDYATVKYDANGNEEWVSRYNGPGDDWDCPHRNAVDSDENMYVTGSSVGAGTDTDYATLKYSPSGDLEAEERYDSGSGGPDSPWGLAVDEAGIVYVTGYSAGPEAPGADADYTTIKYHVATGVPDNEVAEVRLHLCSPNPFSHSTNLHFDFPLGRGPVTLAMYDLRGRVVRRLLDTPNDTGDRSARWDGTDERGIRLPAGVYFARLEVEEEVATRKVVLLR